MSFNLSLADHLRSVGSAPKNGNFSLQFLSGAKRFLLCSVAAAVFQSGFVSAVHS